MPLLSVFAPNSIKVAFDRQQSINCTTMAPRNLTSMQTSNLTDYSIQSNAVFLSGTYFPPANPCIAALGSQCSYTVDFVGPALDCEDVTASSNYTAFENIPFATPPDTNVWISFMEGDDSNREMRLSIQTWNVQELIYQATNCTGVSREYSLLITHNSSSKIEVINSTTIAPVLVDLGTDLSVQSTTSTFGVTTGSVVPFMQQYLYYTMWILLGEISLGEATTKVSNMVRFPNLLGTVSQEETTTPTVDNTLSMNITWNKDMPDALEQYAENVTLSILSNQIFALGSPDVPNLLEETATTCNYTYTAYEYSPARLFASYGVAIFMTVLCVIGGFHAIKQNGVDETMLFSRFLRAVMNERMYTVRKRLDKDSVIKADDDAKGSFAPFLNSKL